MIHKINIAKIDFIQISTGDKEYWHGLPDNKINVDDIIKFNYSEGIPSKYYYIEVIVTDEYFLNDFNEYQIVHFRLPQPKQNPKNLITTSSQISVRIETNPALSRSMTNKVALSCNPFPLSVAAQTTNRTGTITRNN